MSFVIDHIILFLFFLLLFPLSFSVISESITLLGIYHPIRFNVAQDLNISNEGTETFSEKLLKIYKINFRLSLVFIINYYIVISSLIEQSKIDSSNVLWLSSILTLATLATIRISLNMPNTFVINFMHPNQQKIKILSKTREKQDKISSYYYSFVFITMITTGILALLSYLREPPISDLNYLNTLNNPFDYLKVAFIVFFALSIDTLLVEIFLLIFPPLITLKPIQTEESIQIEESKIRLHNNNTYLKSIISLMFMVTLIALYIFKPQNGTVLIKLFLLIAFNLAINIDSSLNESPFLTIFKLTLFTLLLADIVTFFGPLTFIILGYNINNYTINTINTVNPIDATYILLYSFIAVVIGFLYQTQANKQQKIDNKTHLETNKEEQSNKTKE